MFAIVESGSITSMPGGNKGVEINGVKHSADVFTGKWTESERNAIGVYTIEIDNTNKKDSAWYTNTDITYAFGSGKVTGSYGTATAKPIADIKWTQKEIDDGKAPDGADTDTVAVEGLKTKLIRTIKSQAEGELNKTDWYVTRKTEESTAIPSAVTTHRKAVRSKQASMETSITNASDTPALETLYTVVNTADEGDTPVYERPLGKIPVKEF